MSGRVSFAGAPVPVREDIPEAHARTWDRLARPGNWWSGGERVAIASEVRAARECALCRERKQSLSPGTVEGKHASVSALPGAAIEVIHRVTTDPARLSRAWFDGVISSGLSDAQYVEIIGIVVALASIDALCLGLGIPPHALPEPEEGEASRQRPGGLETETGWVPMIGEPGPGEADLFPGSRAANVIRAMSLVPDAVRTLRDLSSAHYYGPKPRAIDRTQIELIAGRVSALNECFY